LFWATYDLFSHELAKEMKSEFEMSMIDELNLFFGIQIKQNENGIVIYQSKYTRYIVNMFGIEGKSHARTFMNTSVKISSDPTSVLILHFQEAC